MSGGTDSSVAALVLLDAGYEVTGVTFRFYEKGGDTEYLDDARDLCGHLGIRHLVYDARDLFRERIVRYFIREYMAGRTPVPCTLCNNYLKWPLLQQVADREGIACLSTGHYVRKRFIDGYWHIVCGEDPDKDQSFFLWGLPQDILSRMLLPLGGLSKARVREMAAERGFMKAACKRDSLGVCFCPMDYRTFLKEHVPSGKISPGYFYDEAGACLGKHEGYPFYTIGQRRGLGIYQNKALFVKEILPQENRIVVSDNLRALEKEDLLHTHYRLLERTENVAKAPFGHGKEFPIDDRSIVVKNGQIGGGCGECHITYDVIEFYMEMKSNGNCFFVIDMFGECLCFSFIRVFSNFFGIRELALF